MASEENFDYTGAKAVEEWLRLKAENKALRNKLRKNNEQMGLLLQEFPVIGNLKGMLRKNKAEGPKEPSKEQPQPTIVDDRRSPSRTGPTPSKKRPSDSRIEIDKILKAKKSSKKQRTAPTDTGAGQFHATSHTAPAHSTTSAMIENKGTSS